MVLLAFCTLVFVSTPVVNTILVSGVDDVFSNRTHLEKRGENPEKIMITGSIWRK